MHPFSGPVPVDAGTFRLSLRAIEAEPFDYFGLVGDVVLVVAPFSTTGERTVGRFWQHAAILILPCSLCPETEPQLFGRSALACFRHVPPIPLQYC
jgi:hypothetical protein